MVGGQERAAFQVDSIVLHHRELVGGQERAALQANSNDLDHWMVEVTAPSQVGWTGELSSSLGFTPTEGRTVPRTRGEGGREVCETCQVSVGRLCGRVRVGR